MSWNLNVSLLWFLGREANIRCTPVELALKCRRGKQHTCSQHTRLQTLYAGMKDSCLRHLIACLLIMSQVADQGLTTPVFHVTCSPCQHGRAIFVKIG